MQPFRRHTGVAAVLARANVDTDQIVPKQFLKRIERSGFGAFLFHDWRFRADGSPNPDFELNRPEARGASILVAGANFGCGSSREHAPWALADYGFRAVIAPSFADIFFGNCCQNGLLPVVLAADEVARLVELGRGRHLELTVDLERGVVTGPEGFRATFTLDPYRREMLLEGLDEIGRTLRFEAKIAAWERRNAGEVPA
ncbi:MAG TPA: 3-isopropylmalate dehydratase small subunit [Gemmatimonadales bacterium]|nr:3-isopropylmalate dehydratase small subunit [Gemmatimonadales bacterium]